MQLTDEQVAWVVLEAGWRGEDAVVAVALALATSGGDSGYASGTVAGQPPDRIGLWGVSVARYPGLAGFDLTDPIISARTAWKLWHVSEHTWAWCEAWTGEGYVATLGRARAAVARPSRTAPIGDTPPAVEELDAAARATAAIRDPRTREPLIGDLRPPDLPPHQL